MKRSIRLAILVSGLFAALSANAEIYKWKDKDGKTHFSDMPPGNVDAQPIKPRRKPAPPPVIEAEEEGEGEGKAASPGTEAKPATPAPAPADPNEEFRKRRAAATEAKTKAEQDAARAEQRKQDCQRARLQYQAISSGQRMARPTEGGGRTFISEEERAAELQRTQKLIDSLCSDK
jgi:hypothetical protein